MDLRQLRLFRRIVAEGSFSRAAAVLGIAQPALSRQVRALEEELGIRLLHRNGRGVIPTEDGRRFAEAVAPVLDDLARIRDEAIAAQGVARGRLRVAMPPSVAAALGPALMRHLRAEMPGVQLHLQDAFTGTILEWLTRGEVDVAVLNSMRRSAAVSTEPLYDAHLFLVHPPGDPRVLRRLTPEGEITLAEAASLPLLLPGRHHGVRREIEAALSAAGLRATRIEDIDSLTGVKHMVAEGLGYTLFAWDAVALEIQAGILAATRVCAPVLLHGFVIGTSADVSPAGRAVVRFLRAEVQRRIADGRLRASPG
nr:LysR family transcriptional regulator [uncultured Roseococcus sp.]